MHIIAMYTPEYEKYRDRLINSILKFKLKYRIYPIENKGDWLLNCKQNTDVILKAFEELNDDLLYLDCDAEFRKSPRLIKRLSCDIAYHVIRYPNKVQLCSGTLYLKNTPKIIKLIHEWKELNSLNDEWDDDNLKHLLNTDYKDLNQYILPEQYCSIDINRIQTGKNPIIRHHQASRKMKKVINE